MGGKKKQKKKQATSRRTPKQTVQKPKNNRQPTKQTLKATSKQETKQSSKANMPKTSNRQSSKQSDKDKATKGRQVANSTPNTPKTSNNQTSKATSRQPTKQTSKQEAKQSLKQDTKQTTKQETKDRSAEQVEVEIIKPSSKVQPRNEFRNYKKSGHPTYIFRKDKRYYDFIGLTHQETTISPITKKEEKNIKLLQNPNSQDSETSHLRPNPERDKTKYFDKEIKKGWKFAEEDLDKVKDIKNKPLKKLVIKKEQHDPKS